MRECQHPNWVYQLNVVDNKRKTFQHEPSSTVSLQRVTTRVCLDGLNSFSGRAFKS